jgi:hypothetical protein
MTLLSSTGDWPARVLLTLSVLAAIAGCLALMRRGWKRRAQRQGEVAALPAVPPVPSAFNPDDVTSVPARYVGASRSGDWLDRLVVHGLGVPSRAHVTVRTSHPTTAGVWVLRTGAPDLFVAAAELQAVRHDRAVAGRAYENDGVVVLTWLHGGALIDVGLRVRDTDVAEQLRHAIAWVAARPSAASTAGGLT